VVKRSRNVAGGMSKGVQFLMKKNKIDVINGHGTLKKARKLRSRMIKENLKRMKRTT